MIEYKVPISDVADCVSDCMLDLFYSNGDKYVKHDKLNVLSLLSGCGGMDIGFEGGFICHKKSVPTLSKIERAISNDWVLLKKNRFHTVFANDILPEAQKTWLKYMRRFEKEPDMYHLESVVNLIKLHESGHKIFPNNIDVVTGGFPCQDFSVAGKRKGFESEVLHDGKKNYEDSTKFENRGRLYYWMKQVIDIVKPKMFVAENVKGLVSLGDVKNIIQRDFASAGDGGYVVLDPVVLNAGDYGVPETRERVIFIGIKKSALREEVRLAFESHDLPDSLSPFPNPTHNYTIGDEGLSAPVTCEDILKELKEPEESNDNSQKFYSKAKYMGAHCQGQTEINLHGLGPTIRSEHHGNIEYRRLSVEHGGKNVEELAMGLKERRLTPRECALIQTFPPDYPFVFYKGHTSKLEVSPSMAYKVIGNAVPPVLAYNIACRIESLWNTYFGKDE